MATLETLDIPIIRGRDFGQPGSCKRAEKRDRQRNNGPAVLARIETRSVRT